MRPRTLLTLLCMSLALSLGVAGAAASDPPAHGDAAHAAAAHGDDAHAADKPALLQWDLGTALWSIIVFLILLTVLRVTAWKPVLKGLQQRENFITESLARARHEREASEKLLAEYNAKLAAARDEAHSIIDEGRRDAEEVKKRIHNEAKAEADAILSRARRDIQIARDDAIKQLNDQAILLATSIASKIVRKELTVTDHQKLLDESLAELSQTSNT
ncbi:MAG: ATP synthase F0 subunit B [Planctomycetota bacterium]|nr:MAG: ATP synthase F0 subunit B [Planctomycetota bacterium]